MGVGEWSGAERQAHARISHCPVSLVEGIAVIHLDLEGNATAPSTLHPHLVSRGLMPLLTPEACVHLRGPRPPVVLCLAPRKMKSESGGPFPCSSHTLLSNLPSLPEPPRSLLAIQ